jgi:hypothetical protein
MKNHVIAIEPIFRHEDDNGQPGYVKCYKLGNRWTWKAVGDKSQASKFTLDTAEWKSKKLTDSNGYGQVIFYPEEI